MNAYLYFVAVCGALCIFFAGMAVGAFIVERQHKKESENDEVL